MVHVDSGPLAERYELSHVMQVVLNSKQVVLRISKNINIGISLTVPSLSFFPCYSGAAVAQAYLEVLRAEHFVSCVSFHLATVLVFI